jgi:hypothetical protein
MCHFTLGYIGLCKEKSKLSLFIYLQPLVIIIEIIIAIVDFLGFNGFVKVAQEYNNGRGFQGTLGLVVSLIYVAMAFLSSNLYLRLRLPVLSGV